jgi:hypothetical protein
MITASNKNSFIGTLFFLVSASGLSLIRRVTKFFGTLSWPFSYSEHSIMITTGTSLPDLLAGFSNQMTSHVRYRYLLSTLEKMKMRRVDEVGSEVGIPTNYQKQSPAFRAPLKQIEKYLKVTRART